MQRTTARTQKRISFKLGAIILGAFTLILLVVAAIVIKQGYDETEAFKVQMQAEVDEVLSYLRE